MRGKTVKNIRKLVRNPSEKLLLEILNMYGDERTKEMNDIYKPTKKLYMALKRNGEHKKLKELFEGGN